MAAQWQEYRDSGSLAARDALVLHYMPLVQAIARTMSRSLPASVEVDDLVSFGMFGLFDAVAKFDPARHVRFASYASTRVRGAIVDELRAADWLPRSVRSQARQIAAVVDAAHSAGLPVPSAEQIAAQVDLDAKSVHQVRALVAQGNVRSLDELNSLDPGLAPRDTVADAGLTPEQMVERREESFLLARAIETLGERERLVVVLSFYEGRTLGEIGTILGVTESRVSQMRTAELGRLRTMLQATARG